MLLSTAPIMYFFENSAVLLLQFDVGGTPEGIPWPQQWDGSLWTLLWEVFCYVGIAIAGVTGLLNRRWLIPAALALALCCSALLPSWSMFAEVPLTAQHHVNAATGLAVMAAVAARFAVMFLAGAMLYQLRNEIPARWSLVAASAVIIAASSLMPNYRLPGGIALAYAVIVSGALVHHERLRLRTDLSYGVYIYAFPVQQRRAVRLRTSALPGPRCMIRGVKSSRL